MNDGTVKTCGLQFSGQLGDGTTTNRLTPTTISLGYLTRILFTLINHSINIYRIETFKLNNLKVSILVFIIFINIYIRISYLAFFLIRISNINR